jgi:hypothetical protein
MTSHVAGADADPRLPDSIRGTFPRAAQPEHLKDWWTAPAETRQGLLFSRYWSRAF